MNPTSGCSRSPSTALGQFSFILSSEIFLSKWFNSKRSLDFEMDEDLAGGASYDKHGTPITDEVFYKALELSLIHI